MKRAERQLYSARICSTNQFNDEAGGGEEHVKDTACKKHPAVHTDFLVGPEEDQQN